MAEKLAKGRCARGCNLVIDRDLLNYKEKCKGREVADSRFNAAANASANAADLRRRIGE